jgi:hypothetical protein
MPHHGEPLDDEPTRTVRESSNLGIFSVKFANTSTGS